MKNLLVIYGGKSVEHDISIITAIQTMESINKQKYNILPVYITKQGEFITVDDYLKVDTYKTVIKKFHKLNFCFSKQKVEILGFVKKTFKVDCLINCCHGVNGEDGLVPALSKLLDVPCSSSDMLSSVICLDKIIMKDCFVANDIPCVNYVWTTKEDYQTDSKKVIDKVYNKLHFPVIIKPSNLGSSIGIGIARNNKQLKECLDVACEYDFRIIIEQCLEDFKEINCSVLNNNGNIECSVLEQPCGWKDFLNFKDKYLTGGKDSSARKINPELKQETVHEIYNTSKEIYKICNCSGVVRIDFMLDSDNIPLANEINAVPGSLSYYLWDKKNISFDKLIDIIVETAILEYNNKTKIIRTYQSSVLNGFNSNKMNKYTK